VRFQTTNVDATFNGGSYVTSTPALEQATLQSFLHGDEHASLPAPKPHSSAPAAKRAHHHRAPNPSPAASARALNLFPTSSTGQAEAVKAAIQVPFRVLYPSLQTGPAEQQTVRAYGLKDESGRPHHAYVIVWRQNTIGGYYDFEGSDWLSPPLFAHTRSQSIAGHEYKFVDDGAHIHVVGWVSGRVLYWLTNTLLEELSNAQMIAIARSAQGLH